MVRPVLGYGATIWLNGTRTQHNEKLLNGVQRLANVLITGAMPSTPGVALDVITGNIPITLWLEEESAKGALRLKNLNHWQHPPSGKLNMRLTSHITTNEKLLKSISEVRVPHDQKTPSLSIDQEFAVDIPNRDVFSEPIESEYDVNCYTDGSKMNEHVGAGIVVKSSPSKGGLNHNEAFHLDKHNTVLQAEVFAVGKTATFLLDNKIEGSKIMINCDSQAAIRAIDSTVIKNSTTLEATMAINTLGESNEITLRWIPAHCGYEGNELADQLAKRGSNNDRATRIKLPMPRCVCYAALRRKTRVSWSKSYKLNPPKMFNILWRDKFSKDLIRMNKRDLRAATQILTGHACLNYHLSKLNRSVQPLCPLCEAEYDTVPHLLAQCPMLWQLRVEFFDTHYTTVTDIVDRYNLRRIIGYVNRTNRLEF